MNCFALVVVGTTDFKLEVVFVDVADAPMEGLCFATVARVVVMATSDRQSLSICCARRTSEAPRVGAADGK